MLADRMAGPFNSIVNIVGSWQETMARSKDLFAVMEEPYEEYESGEILGSEINMLKFDNVSFAYNSEMGDVLSGINFEAKTAATIALVGPNGTRHIPSHRVHIQTATGYRNKSRGAGYKAIPRPKAAPSNSQGYCKKIQHFDIGRAYRIAGCRYRGRFPDRAKRTGGGPHKDYYCPQAYHHKKRRLYNFLGQWPDCRARDTRRVASP